MNGKMKRFMAMGLVLLLVVSLLASLILPYIS